MIDLCELIYGMHKHSNMKYKSAYRAICRHYDHFVAMMNIIVHDFLFYLETIAIVLLFTYVAFHFEMRDWPESQGI